MLAQAWMQMGVVKMQSRCDCSKTLFLRIRSTTPTSSTSLLTLGAVSERHLTQPHLRSLTQVNIIWQLTNPALRFSIWIVLVSIASAIYLHNQSQSVWFQPTQ